MTSFSDVSECGSALDWFADFLKDGTHGVRAGVMRLKYRVAQDSVNGPKRYIEYADDVTC